MMVVHNDVLMYQMENGRCTIQLNFQDMCMCSEQCRYVIVSCMVLKYMPMYSNIKNKCRSPAPLDLSGTFLTCVVNHLWIYITVPDRQRKGCIIRLSWPRYRWPHCHSNKMLAILVSWGVSVTVRWIQSDILLSIAPQDDILTLTHLLDRTSMQSRNLDAYMWMLCFLVHVGRAKLVSRLSLFLLRSHPWFQNLTWCRPLTRSLTLNHSELQKQPAILCGHVFFMRKRATKILAKMILSGPVVWLTFTNMYSNFCICTHIYTWMIGETFTTTCTSMLIFHVCLCVESINTSVLQELSPCWFHPSPHHRQSQHQQLSAWDFPAQHTASSPHPSSAKKHVW